jgi:hypothetical protein
VPETENAARAGVILAKLVEAETSLSSFTVPYQVGLYNIMTLCDISAIRLK